LEGCLDGSGILYVLPVLTVRKTLNKFAKLEISILT